MLGVPLAAALPLLDAGPFSALWERCRDEGSAIELEVPLTDGRWLRLEAVPVSDAGKVRCFVGALTDVTERRGIPDRQHIDAQSKAVLDNAVDAIVSTDVAGRVQSFNRAAQALFGYGAEEVIGENVRMLMPEPHRSRHDGYMQAYLKTGLKRIMGIGREVEALRKDGTRVPVYLAVSEVIVDGERTFTGILRDISRRRAAEAQIRRQNERLDAVVQHAPLGIVTYRFGAHIETSNRTFVKLLGINQQALSGRAYLDLLHPEDRPAFAAVEAEARNGARGHFTHHHRLVTDDGRSVAVVSHAAVAHDESGTPDLLIVHVEDLTHAHAAAQAAQDHEDKLAHVGRLTTLGEMTAGIAHEINQPLTAIAMYAQSSLKMLEAGVPRPERLARALEKLGEQSLRAGAVIERMQRFVKSRSSQREPLDINAAIADVVRLAESDARLHGIRLVSRLAPDLPTVWADPIQIQQVVLNLIRNGIDAMVEIDCRHGHDVHLTTCRENDAVRVAIGDRGSGVGAISEAELFTPFRTTKAEGLGMGLSICRSIVDHHRGRLRFENNPDCGATFYFTLPVEGGPAEGLEGDDASTGR